MVYGLNFNGTSIPREYDRHFTRTLRCEGAVLRLQGVADSGASIDHMVEQADNGRRRIQVVTKDVRGRTLYGVYIG